MDIELTSICGEKRMANSIHAAHISTKNICRSMLFELKRNLVSVNHAIEPSL